MVTNPSEFTEVRQPKLLSYCSLLYNRFDEEAVNEAAWVESENDKAVVRVWRGYVTKAAKEVGIPDGVYKRVMNQLHHMQCVEQIERGYRGKGSQTLIILLKPPTAEDWQDERDSSAGSLTRRLDPAILDRRVKALEDQLKGVNILRALADLQRQLDQVEVSVDQLIGKTQKESE